MNFAKTVVARHLAALTIPFIACALQLFLWDPFIKPFVWLLFFPTVFLGGWVAGPTGSLLVTPLSCILVWYFFIPPRFSFEHAEVSAISSVLIYCALGGLVSWFFYKLQALNSATTSRLSQSEILFEATFDQAAVGIAIVAPDGRWVRVNHKLSGILGFTASELMETDFQAITYPDDLLKDLDNVEKMIAREIDTYSMEKRYLRKDRTIVWANLTVSMVSDEAGRPSYFVAVVEDISERKRAEGALAESEQRLSLFIDHAPAALAMFDREMRYVAASRRWRDDYALGASEIAGKSHYELFPDIPERWKNAHRAGLAGEVVHAEHDSFIFPDGRRQWLRWEVRPWREATGEVGGIVIFAEDITSAHDAAEEIRALNASLEKRVVERTAELSAANEELESFTYAVSHDLRAPLRAMRGFSRALVEDFERELPDEAKAYLNEIDEAGHRMGDLIDGLLLLSRIVKGELRRDTVDLTAMSERLLNEMSRQERERRVSYSLEAGLEVIGDTRMIEIAMRNLLGNAWKYTSRQKDAEIRLYTESRADGRRICIADNGEGFDMAHGARLFQPFQRLHRTDEFPGIGIGLATVQRIIRRHGGTIDAIGAPGKGATFSFSLPSAADIAH